MDFELLIPIIAILSSVALPIAAGIILGLRSMKSRHAERMGLIEQGIIPPQKERRKATPSRLVALRNGIIFASLGLGSLVALLLMQYTKLTFSPPPIVYGVSILLFLGMGYLIYFWVSRDMYDNEKREGSDNNDLA